MRNDVPDNGKLHYGAGLRMSLCGCVEPKRLETGDRSRVTCPDCKANMKRTGR